MKRKNGFIATSLIYSFFLAFVTLFLTVVADYLQNKVLLNSIEEGIKTEVNAELYAKDYYYSTPIVVVNSCGGGTEENNCTAVASNKKVKVTCDGTSEEVNFVVACYNSDGTINKDKVMIK